MDGIWTVLAATLPHLVWAAVLVGLACFLGAETLRSVLGRVESVSAAGVEVRMREDLSRAADRQGAPLERDAAARIARRLAESRRVLDGARVLWVDDNPENNGFERLTLETAGVLLDLATSDWDAMDRLNSRTYDLVLSDMERNGRQDAGAAFLVQMKLADHRTPVIFYVRRLKDGTPRGAFGITDRPDELMHLVVDALSRVRG